jgi:hypothetical protein
MGIEPCGCELLSYVLIAAGVVAEAVDQQHGRPRKSGPGPSGLRLVGRPVANEQIRSV